MVSFKKWLFCSLCPFWSHYFPGPIYVPRIVMLHMYVRQRSVIRDHQQKMVGKMSGSEQIRRVYNRRCTTCLQQKRGRIRLFYLFIIRYLWIFHLDVDLRVLKLIRLRLLNFEHPQSTSRWNIQSCLIMTSWITFPLATGDEHAENILFHGILKKIVPNKFTSYVVGRCNFILNLYKQQNIDSLSSKGWFNHFSPGFAYNSFCRRGIWALAAYVSMHVYLTS